ncbi:MAG: hypothetical protein PW792_15295 [Acidobacteriaceae bacterium]|nr:hypothetical protein [Acidobacteriaceae bacterium]
MSKQASNAGKQAMIANDQRSNPAASRKSAGSSLRGHEHTRPQGDLRAVADRADSHNAYRGDFNRGH